MFAPATYRDRRRVLRDALAGPGERGLLLFLGNDESPCNYTDNTYPYRQDSTFLYYFGIDRPGFAAVMDLDEGGTTVYADDPGIEAIVWTGPQPSTAELAARGGVDDVVPAGAQAWRVARASAGGRSVK